MRLRVIAFVAVLAILAYWKLNKLRGINAGLEFRSTALTQNHFVPFHHAAGLYKKPAKGNNQTPRTTYLRSYRPGEMPHLQLTALVTITIKNNARSITGYSIPSPGWRIPYSSRAT
jgi:hypothetical protein